MDGTKINEINERLTDIMGLCWHVPDPASEYGESCKLCGVDTYDFLTKSFTPVVSMRPDFSTPQYRAELLDWVIRQPWFEKFIWFVCGKTEDKMLFGSEIVRYMWCELPALVDEYWQSTSVGTEQLPPLGKRLAALRSEAIANGMELLTEEEVLEEKTTSEPRLTDKSSPSSI